MQTSLRRKFRDRVVRRGLGLVIESDVRSSLPSPLAARDRSHARALLRFSSTPPRRVANILPISSSRSDTVSRRCVFDNPRFTDRPPFAFAPTHAACLCNEQTCNFDVLYAYLVSTPVWPQAPTMLALNSVFAWQTCGNYDFSYDKSKNLRAPLRPRTARSTPT